MHPWFNYGANRGHGDTVTHGDLRPRESVHDAVVNFDSFHGALPKAEGLRKSAGYTVSNVVNMKRKKKKRASLLLLHTCTVGSFSTIWWMHHWLKFATLDHVHVFIYLLSNSSNIKIMRYHQQVGQTFPKLHLTRLSRQFWEVIKWNWEENTEYNALNLEINMKIRTKHPNYSTLKVC